MDRKEAVALLKELGTAHLIQPTFVLIKQRTPDSCELLIKGDYDLKEIDRRLKNRKFCLEEKKDYLIISRP